MNRCEYQKYYDEYIKGDLAPELDIEFQRHLQDCRICEREIEQFYQGHRQLQALKRGAFDDDVKAEYHQALKAMFKPVPDRFSPREFLHELVFTHSRKLRLAEVVTVLITGILIGWFFFYDGAPTISPGSTATGYYGKPISRQDMEYLNYYFLASEIVLLEMVNGDLAEDDFFLEKETAQKLLIKTFLVHEVALKLNDPKMLRFLTRMEMILYELSNADQDQLAETLSSVRFIIDDGQLLSEVRELKQLIADSGTPATMPG